VSSDTEKTPQKKENALISSLFADDDDENYTFKDEGPASLDAFFSAALQDAQEEESSDPAAKVFEDESVLDSELDRAFNELVEKAEKPDKASAQTVEKTDKTVKPDKSSAQAPEDTDKSDKMDKSDKAEKPDKADVRDNDYPSDTEISRTISKTPDEKAEKRDKTRDEGSSNTDFSKPAWKDSAIPDWCAAVSFPELDSFNSELATLKKEVSETRAKIDKSYETVSRITDLKNALLSMSGSRLNHSCCVVFEELGWSVQMSSDQPNEIWLKVDNEIRAIVRIVSSSEQADSLELANLAKSVIRHWDKYDFEPKGILLASTFMNKSPQERSHDSFTKPMTYFAERRNLCLLTCTQLLSIYLGVYSGSAQRKTICKNLLSNAGAMPAWTLDSMRIDD